MQGSALGTAPSHGTGSPGPPVSPAGVTMGFQWGFSVVSMGFQSGLSGVSPFGDTGDLSHGKGPAAAWRFPKIRTQILFASALPLPWRREPLPSHGHPLHTSVPQRARGWGQGQPGGPLCIQRSVPPRSGRAWDARCGFCSILTHRPLAPIALVVLS